MHSPLLQCPDAPKGNEFESTPCDQDLEGGGLGVGQVWDFDFEAAANYMPTSDDPSLLSGLFLFWQGHPNDKMQNCEVCKLRCSNEPGCTHFYSAAESIPVPAEVPIPEPVQNHLGQSAIPCVL
jgi:hypothetical protein